jgi:hypothetical protein
MSVIISDAETENGSKFAAIFAGRVTTAADN